MKKLSKFLFPIMVAVCVSIFSCLPVARAGTNFLFIGNSNNPSTIKNDLLYWFRATDGITKDGSNFVSQWDDLSTNGYNATATGNHTPTWTNGSSPNGKPCLSFDGASGSTDNDFLEFASGINLFSDGAARSYFGTLQSVSKGGTYYNALVLNRTSTTNKNFAIVASNDATYGNFWFGSFNANTGVQSAIGDVTSAVTNFRLNYNGGSVTSFSSYTVALSNSNQLLSVTTSLGSPSGNANRIGEWSPTGATLAWKGLVCELGAYASAYSGTEEAKINSYQTGFWGN